MVEPNDQQIIQSAQKLLSSRREIATASVLPTHTPDLSFSASSLVDEKDLETLKKRQEIAQQDKRFEAEMEQRRIDRELKKAIANLVFRFLATETGALFIVVLIQGFSPWGFHLEDSTINIFLGATLLQISSMAVIITRHLYPTSPA
ncbi:MAG: hypothetical protein ABI425_05170 [Patescibacteria group bacterium]